MIPTLSSSLQDGPENAWDKRLVATVITRYVKKWSIETIITFDAQGVSGHPNHIAAFEGVRFLLSKDGISSQYPIMLRGYKLRSIPFWRKYIGVADIWPTMVGAAWGMARHWWAGRNMPMQQRVLEKTEGYRAADNKAAEQKQQQQLREDKKEGFRLRSSSSPASSPVDGTDFATTTAMEAHGRRSRSRSRRRMRNASKTRSATEEKPMDKVTLNSPVSSDYSPGKPTHAPLVYISGAFEFDNAISAMTKHVSQLVWFRRLYVAFSRYMLINELDPIEQ